MQSLVSCLIRRNEKMTLTRCSLCAKSLNS
jgi:hypothetical protein